MSSIFKKFKQFQISKENQKLINGSTSGYNMTMSINSNPCTCGEPLRANGEQEYGTTYSGLHFSPCSGEGSYLTFTTVN